MQPRPGWPVRLWRSNPAAAWTGAVATLVFGIAGLWVGVPGSTEGGSALSGPPSASPPGTDAATVRPPSPSLPRSLPAVSLLSGRCSDPTTSTPIDCTAPTAWLAVDSRPCTVETLLIHWGVDQELTSLLVVVKHVGGRCWAAPTSEALAAGGRAHDLHQMSASSAPAVLRACARGEVGRLTVSCSQTHELEWVGGWRSLGQDEPGDHCRVLGQRYTNSSLAEAAGRVEALALQGRQANGSVVYRCALRVRGSSFAGSLHNVGDGLLSAGSPDS